VNAVAVAAGWATGGCADGEADGTGAVVGFAGTVVGGAAIDVDMGVSADVAGAAQAPSNATTTNIPAKIKRYFIR
jgi:hypothetical protein